MKINTTTKLNAWSKAQMLSPNVHSFIFLWTLTRWWFFVATFTRSRFIKYKLACIYRGSCTIQETQPELKPLPTLQPWEERKPIPYYVPGMHIRARVEYTWGRRQLGQVRRFIWSSSETRGRISHPEWIRGGGKVRLETLHQPVIVFLCIAAPEDVSRPPTTCLISREPTCARLPLVRNHTVASYTIYGRYRAQPHMLFTVSRFN